RTMPGPQLLAVYDQLLGTVMPSSLLVDENYQLMHTFGGAERLLRVKGGRPSNNVLDLVDERVKAPLLGALQHAYKERTAVKLNAISIGDIDYKLVVEPLREQHSASSHFLVRFESQGARSPEAAEKAVDVPGESRDYVQALETELRFTKESLQATIEELETS